MKMAKFWYQVLHSINVIVWDVGWVVAWLLTCFTRLVSVSEA